MAARVGASVIGLPFVAQEIINLSQLAFELSDEGPVIWPWADHAHPYGVDIAKLHELPLDLLPGFDQLFPQWRFFAACQIAFYIVWDVHQICSPGLPRASRLEPIFQRE